MKRKSWPVVAVFAVFLVLASCNAERKDMEILADVNSCEKEYVPDSRLAAWNTQITVKDGKRSIEGYISTPEGFKALESLIKDSYPEVSFEVRLVPETLDEMPVNALVNNSVIHLRKKPSSKTEMVTQTLLGTPVQILVEESEKYLIQLPDGYIGWVNIAEVKPLKAECYAAYRDAEKLMFMQQYGFVYSEADISSQVVGDLVIGNILVKLADQGAFIQVRYPDGRIGYVLAEEVLPMEEVFGREASAKNIIATAMRYMGIPYLWGGTSSKNIDCSGLMVNAYFLNGIQLPRDADLQTKCGREITVDYSSEGLEPGDLLFWGSKAKDGKPERTTHVGMYIGDGEFIHSAGHHERVSINSMDSTKANYIEGYPEIFVRAVRILGEEGGYTRVSENPFFNSIIKP